jgi:hypothetical protein
MKYFSFFLLLVFYTPNFSFAFDPRELLNINNQAIPFDNQYFDKTVELLGSTHLQVTGDASTSDTYVEEPLSDKSAIVRFSQYECGFGITITRLKEEKRKNYKTPNKKIEILGLRIGLSRDAVETFLTLGKVKGHYTGKIDINDKTIYEVEYDQPEKAGESIYSPLVIMISITFDDQGFVKQIRYTSSDC